jgi:acetyl esterase/lipase
MSVMHIRPLSHLVRQAFTGLALLIGVAACAPARLLDVVTPEGDYTRETDVAYGPLARQRLDVYRPRNPDALGTVVVFFYGGGWRAGTKGDYRFVAESLTRQGITVVIPDYRIYPEAVFPAFVEDAALVTRWVRDNAVRLSIDRARVFLIGHSAGAHIVALVALDPRYLAAVGRRPRDIAGVVGISGPYDFLPITSPRVREIFAAAPDLAATQPVTFVTANAPPMLLVHGMEDRTVYPRNSQRLAARLHAADAPVRLVLYPDRGHVDIMLGLSSVFSGGDRLMQELTEFLAQPCSSVASTR